nr:MAG TPA: hypothetical protein [Caudoviricetes sp.]
MLWRSLLICQKYLTNSISLLVFLTIYYTLKATASSAVAFFNPHIKGANICF